MKIMCITLFVLSIVQYSQSWNPRKRRACKPVRCEYNCRKIYDRRGCPTCDCPMPECAMPMCSRGCELKNEFHGPCPGCDCSGGKEIPEPTKSVCPAVDCKSKCRPEIGPDGCEVCKCDVPLCSPPKCAPGCEIETVYEGPCPGCKCDKDVGTSGNRKPPACEPVVCGFDCRKSYNPRRCPICICEKPTCPIPMCSPGCKLKAEFNGPCPGCDCSIDKENAGPKKPVCPPVDCKSNCRPETGPDGCEVCKCDVPLCSPPKCEPGCEIETVYEGPCPGCKCDKDVGTSDNRKPPACEPVHCGLNCRKGYNPKVCPICICETPECPVPMCSPGCNLKAEFNGSCPGCDCSVEKEIAVPKKPVCPPVDCTSNCRPEIGLDGCKACKCDVPLCSPPKCEPGCEIQTAYEGPCPGCKCNKDVGTSGSYASQFRANINTRLLEKPKHNILKAITSN